VTVGIIPQIQWSRVFIVITKSCTVNSFSSRKESKRKAQKLLPNKFPSGRNPKVSVRNVKEGYSSSHRNRMLKNTRTILYSVLTNIFPSCQGRQQSSGPRWRSTSRGGLSLLRNSLQHPYTLYSPPTACRLILSPTYVFFLYLELFRASSFNIQ
jgi:hypothetical protein